jgi:hypothetical protein
MQLLETFSVRIGRPKCLLKYSRPPLGLLLALAAILPCGHPLYADEVAKWNGLGMQLAVGSNLANLHPLVQIRAQAMADIAMHDALNTIDRRYRSYTEPAPFAPNASPQAAVAAAAYTVLLDQFAKIASFGFPDFHSELNAAYQNSLAGIPAGPAKTVGIEVGAAAASRILSMRASDGAYLLPVVDATYPQGTRPGEYKFTPGFTFVYEPLWGSVRPFALSSSRDFYPDPPYPIGSSRYAKDFNEVKSLGGDGVITPSARTPDQTQIALFWFEASPTAWNRIAQGAADTTRLNLWENARMFALLNIALADGYIGSFQAKYDFNFWRPVTAIHEGDADGNNDTAGDPSWTPLLPTAPIPDHDSGHSVAGGACAEVLERFFGERFHFQTCSGTLPAGGRCGDPAPVYRSYNSFSEAALENGLSRIYVGYHFRRAVTEGIEHGRSIGKSTFQNHLGPAHGNAVQ